MHVLMTGRPNLVPYTFLQQAAEPWHPRITSHLMAAVSCLLDNKFPLCACWILQFQQQV